MGEGIEITMALQRLKDGGSMAFDDLLPLIYGRLRGLADRCMFQERANHTLQATALVHEAYLRLGQQTHVDWEGRGQFFAAAARSMRQVLVDHARAFRAQKRGGDRGRERLENVDPEGDCGASQLDLLALHEALGHLEETDERKAQVVELRYFAGLSSEETADVLGVTARTVDRDWLFAQAWLAQKLSDSAT